MVNQTVVAHIRQPKATMTTTDSTWTVDINPDQFRRWFIAHVIALAALTLAAIVGIGWWACIPASIAFLAAAKALTVFNAVIDLAERTAVKYLETNTDQ